MRKSQGQGTKGGEIGFKRGPPHGLYSAIFFHMKVSIESPSNEQVTEAAAFSLCVHPLNRHRSFGLLGHVNMRTCNWHLVGIFGDALRLVACRAVWAVLCGGIKYDVRCD